MNKNKKIRDDPYAVSVLRVCAMFEKRYAEYLEATAKAPSTPDDYDETPERLAEHAEQIRDDKEDR